MNNNTIRQLFKRLLVIGILLAIAVLFGAFFAFGGSNPLLIHMGNVIDLMLVVITTLFLMGLVYKLYMFFTGTGDAIVSSQKKKNSQQKRSNDDMPELTELIENLDATE